MRIHAGTSGTLPREVGRSLSGHDQVFLPGKKTHPMGPRGKYLEFRGAALGPGAQGFEFYKHIVNKACF